MRQNQSFTATQAKQNFGTLFGKVAIGKEHVNLQKQGKIQAVMIPIDVYEEYLFLKKQKNKMDLSGLLTATHRLRNRQQIPQKGDLDGVEMIRELRHGR
ncbi:MAG: type II toxin-antitoxin system Phd/YefM family antitoxin [Deltaproteobacteria bacterium]|nr:MAG: type II toxin-antitoxin system Phd/YefM family antitoxin [Deltaproteobacteria bacterium]